MRYLIIQVIRFYQLTISPLLGMTCRFSPTCSQYAVEALDEYGFIKGILMIAQRLGKCHPWHPGGHDPVK